MKKNFLNGHVLYTFAGANPNRDDVGSPKSLVYGGVERARMSSQAMTRAKRAGYEADPSGDKAFRSKSHTRNITGRVLADLQDDGVDITPEIEAEVTRIVIESVESLTSKNAKVKAEKAAKSLLDARAEKVKAADAEDSDDVLAKDTVSILSAAEVKKLTKKVKDAIKNSDTDVKSLDFVDGPATTSLSIAAFGRMFANRPDLQTEAAVQRSHAFTTHESVIEMDYFTVFDDLANEDGGAAHLGMKQLTGGVYYWHFTLDRDQLLANLVEEFDLSPERAEAFVRHLVNDLPQGSQNTTAHHHIPPFVMLVEAGAPVSLQTAFESPVQSDGDGHLAPSISRLVAEHEATVARDPELFGEVLITGTHAGQVDDSDVTVDQVAKWFADWVVQNG